MTDKERTEALISYLHALTLVQSTTGVKVFSEIQHVIAEIERILK